MTSIRHQTLIAPTEKLLMERFKGSRVVMTRETAQTIRALVHGCHDGRLEAMVTGTESFPKTRRWAHDCYSSPWHSHGWRQTMLMSALSEMLNGFGEESFYTAKQDSQSPSTWPRFRYVNMGDTYAMTLVLDDKAGRVLVASWSDLTEKHG